MAEALELTTEGPEETQELGRRLGARVEAGDLLLLCGELGSGKTTLAQGIAWGLGVNEYAHSPTFALVHEYHGRLLLYHVDLYRLDDPAEVQELGVTELLAEGVGMVEWAEKAMGVFPPDHLLVELREAGPERRVLRFTPHGERHHRLLDAIRSYSSPPASSASE